MVCKIFFAPNSPIFRNSCGEEENPEEGEKDNPKALCFSSKRNEYEHSLVKIKDQSTLGARTCVGYEFTLAECKESTIGKTTITLGERSQL